jgi:ABC-type glutathione transport system ATPase component
VTARPEPAHLSIGGVRKEFRDGMMFSRKRHVALDDVTLELRQDQGRVLAVVGESGSGKTTLARLILRLQSADAGEITVAGEPIVSRTQKPVGAWRLRRLVQPIFQNPFETFSGQLKLEDYLIRTAINLGDDEDRRSPGKAMERALEAVGMSYAKVKGRGVRAFSGGELQRISIARALIAHPKLIVADEPVSMVDASLRMTIINLFKDLSDRMGIAFVYITHDLSTAYYLADLVAIMRLGRLVEVGPPDEVMQSPKADYTRALLDAIPTLGRRWQIPMTPNLDNQGRKA